ncbi:MAG TPA: CPBP family glutamic-type intramembrane protease [Pirellulales bacterium]|nr:CPBP family glutamic-type intramembrane protease [Pirellulales bacterium]
MGFLVLLFAAGLIAASLTVWAKAAAKWRRGAPLVAYEPRGPFPAKLLDLFVIAVFYVLTNLAVYVVLYGAATPSDGETPALRDVVVALAATALTNLLTMGLAILWIRGRSGASWADLGFGLDKAADDLRLGLAAFAAVSVPVYVLQGFLSQFVREQHPIIELLLKHREPWLLALSGASAVLVAPLAEEFFFRVLLQGWVESLVAPAEPSPAETPSAAVQEPPIIFGPADPDHPYSPAPSTAEAFEVEPLPVEEGAQLPPAARIRVAGVRWDRAAILFSSAIFALMHLGHGAAPIPLFFLALALGYLYQRTGRLLPSVTVHLCLNACSLAALYLGLAAEVK